MDQSIEGSGKHLPVEIAEVFDAAQRNNDWAEQTMRQIEKDFALQGFSISLPAIDPGLDELIGIISKEMQAENLLERTQLLGLLYQLDINESLIRTKISSADLNDPYKLLALEIVKRCFTKVYWRNTLK